MLESEPKDKGQASRPFALFGPAKNNLSSNGISCHRKWLQAKFIWKQLDQSLPFPGQHVSLDQSQDWTICLDSDKKNDTEREKEKE